MRRNQEAAEVSAEQLANALLSSSNPACQRLRKWIMDVAQREAGTAVRNELAERAMKAYRPSSTWTAYSKGHYEIPEADHSPGTVHSYWVSGLQVGGEDRLTAWTMAEMDRKILSRARKQCFGYGVGLKIDDYSVYDTRDQHSLEGPIAVDHAIVREVKS